MPKVLVLGARGMLGSRVASVLAAHPKLEVSTSSRTPGEDLRFDAREDTVGLLLETGEYDWIVNAIGVLKARIDERATASVEEAIAVNALFPHRLAAEAARHGQRVIQIATDGVYAGANGPYDESAVHDPHDVYGKTKSLGEVTADNVWNLRCSIVGPELGPPSLLLGWVLAAEPGTELTGYAGHRWNGITTLHFAKLCAAIIDGVEVPNHQHVVPSDSVSKAELLELILAAFGRTGVRVRHTGGPGAPVDRTLTTRDLAANERLWRAAGYPRPPTIVSMLGELAAVEAARGARDG
jgi:dTDP-4-dehydrorhamnose reductase